MLIFRWGMVAFAGLVAVVAFAAPCAAATGKRIALVITNQAYPKEVGRLGRTHEDGRIVAAALEQVGFKVTVVRDAGKSELRQAVAAYIARLASAGPDAAGFFYYSGHGAAQTKYGENYLVPTDARITDGAQLAFLGVKLGDLIDAIG